jgi:multicomponent Na+:H+ antiporter subunit G
MSIIDYISWGMILLGGFLCVSGAIGILRFPDFFTRMHAASVTDTLAAGLIMGALMLQAPSWIVFAKLAMILIFILLTAPTSGHALAKAALHSGMKPLLRDNNKSAGEV